MIESLLEQSEDLSSRLGRRDPDEFHRLRHVSGESFRPTSKFFHRDSYVISLRGEDVPHAADDIISIRDVCINNEGDIDVSCSVTRMRDGCRP